MRKPKGSVKVAAIRKLRTSNRTNNPNATRGATAGVLNAGNGQQMTVSKGKATVKRGGVSGDTMSTVLGSRKKAAKRPSKQAGRVASGYKPIQLGNAPLSKRGD